jgi:hypothetical protein
LIKTNIHKPEDIPDIVYILYEDSESITKNNFKYKNLLKYSMASFVNCILKSYLIKNHRPRAFDLTASCSNTYDELELTNLPNIHIYSSVDINTSNNKIIYHNLNDVIKMCPISPITETYKYIPILKAATMLYHSQYYDNNKPFILSDVDIIYHNYKNFNFDTKNMYLCGLEYQPMYSFLCFKKGLKIWSNYGEAKQKDIQDYKKYEEFLKIPLQMQIFNNGIIYVPHNYIKDFYDLYYNYLLELSKIADPELRYPYPFWTAEMFATNYAMNNISLNQGIMIRRLDPDVFDLIHDINNQFYKYTEDILNI